MKGRVPKPLAPLSIIKVLAPFKWFKSRICLQRSICKKTFSKIIKLYNLHRNLQQFLYWPRYVLPAQNKPGPARHGQCGLRYFGPIQAFADIRFWVRACCPFALLSLSFGSLYWSLNFLLKISTIKSLG
jgi:hypothetical protein